MPAYVKVVEGSSTSPVQNIRVKGADGVDHAVKAIYEYQHLPKDGSATEYEDRWVKVGEYAPPDIPVPGVSISRGPEVLGPTQFRIAWTISTDSANPAFAWNVSVSWYDEFDSLRLVHSVGQGSGTLADTFDASDHMYALVRYSNTYGSGPNTQTETI